jgi:acid phosphatase type 7
MTDAPGPPEPPSPIEPTEPPESPGESSRAPVAPTKGDRPPGAGAVARGVALGGFGFVATLILLFGLASLIEPSTGGAAIASASPSSAIASLPPASASAGSSEGLASAPPSGARPSATPSGDPVLVGAGDIADCGLDGDRATAALLDDIDGTVFTAGDNAYPDGTADQFRDCYGPTWGRHLARTRPAAGNHDWVTKDLAGYLGYFGAAAAPNRVSWYAYDLETWHVIVLDSDCSAVGGCGPDSAQGRWLAADLAASKARCTLAIWHHPRFSSGEHGNDATVAPFWRALYDAGADLVINGHDHDYERFAPQDTDGREDRARGIREFVVGTGGAELRAFPKAVANSELRVSAYHGVIRLVLHRSSYEWRFSTTSGDFSDSGNGPCH